MGDDVNGRRTANSVSGNAQFDGTTVLADRVELTINQARREGVFVVPNEVPLPPEDFVNREAEVGLFRRLVEQPGDRTGPLVTVLVGSGGVGKSELGHKCAHDLGGLFPDGSLHLSLAPLRRGGVLETGEALAELLRGLGLADGVIRGTAAGRLAQYRSWTFGRRVLLLIDDAQSEDDLRDLLPSSPHSAVLVASHHELHLSGAVTLPVGPLSEEHATRLLAGLVGAERSAAEPQALAELVRICAGLPVALRAAGARLRSRSHWTLSRLVEELTDEDRRLARLEGGRPVMERLWDAVYADLPESAARMYRLLADHPGPDSTVESAAALAGVDGSAAEDDLYELKRVSLLGEREGRFRLHDLIRLHARAQAQAQARVADGGSENETEVALRRIVRWYRRQAERADRAAKGDRLRIAEPLGAVDAPGPDLPFASERQALSWLERERAALFDVVRLAAGSGRHADAAATAEPIGVLFESHRHYVECIEAFTLGVAAAEQLGDRAAEAWLRCQLMRPLWELGRFAQAERQLTAAFAAVERVDRPRLLAAVWERSGKLHQARGELDAAQADFERSQEINEEIDHPRGVMLQLYHLAGVAILRGSAREAITLLDRAAVLAAGSADRRPDRRMTGRIAQAAGAAHLALGERQQAEDALRLALETAVGRASEMDEAQARDALAGIVADPKEAGEHRRRADRLYAAAGGLRIAVASVDDSAGAQE
ncbi:NB-ARC domain-containing protein [Kitasatospora mediocidica]|uniref:NB-ARC domain-containing protein n=1 Tax=Kitasatospora mediocidica TaxID=58352 RepID=UPI00068F0122|nr:NB-ARC domain-containing protein [Kitasatospora mediocidica]